MYRSSDSHEEPKRQGKEMPAPIAFLNGQFVAADQMKVSVVDVGFVQGVTVAEQIRTFGGRLFRLDQHLARLQRSLDIVGVDPGMTADELRTTAIELAAKNHAILTTGDDLGLSIFVTPGPYATYNPQGTAGPTIGMHTYPVPFSLWADKYEQGQHLVTAGTRQVSPLNWPPELKCRSRMHYYLADREARSADPLARAVLLDLEGYVSEASTANILAYYLESGVVSPPKDTILPGFSLATLHELADVLEIPFRYERLTPDDLARADEILLCSTSPCILPVVRLDGKTIGKGEPGSIFRRLLAAWNELVGVDIAAQARRFAKRT